MSRPQWGARAEPEIHALLGPTNTGKTHRALQRMLRHASGMMGFPLRLLAREVYDRVTTQVGEGAVALVTGEERRIPPRPRYWICTVESMPLDRPVDFLAVDEVQLAADTARGHVFTDRVLHARGTVETILLGSDTIAPVLGRLVPGVQIDTRPRLSKLTWAGPRRLGALPRRSAIVAFTAERVYQLAELARRKHGGCAVVMGALSPRTRNAQVALFQSGEVPVLVATDAIGMGLNMDVAHVAFADLHKFDGARVRRLTAAELGQIAGRAGRHLEDGTFGVTDEAPPLGEADVEAVEQQRFPPLRKVRWRSRDLDLRSLDGLRRSLAAPSPSPVLERAEPDEDELALAALAEHPEVRGRAADPEAVALLWEVCRVPDFRKLNPDVHLGLLLRLFLRLHDHGTLAEGWLHRQMEGIDRVDGEIEDLTTRLAAVRTWTYVSHRSEWLDAPLALRERAREVEDRLSDALHERLTERFVDRRALVLAGGGAGSLRGDEVFVGGVRLGRLAGGGWVGEDGGAPPGKVRETVAAELEARVRLLAEAPHAELHVDDDFTLTWRGGALARLQAGPDLLSPQPKLVRSELWSPSMRTRVERRVLAWARDFVAELLTPLRPADAPRGVVRGLLYSLEKGLGTVPTAEVRDLLAELRGPDRAALARAGVRLGVDHVYSMPMLERLRDRALLVAVAAGLPELPMVPGAPVEPVSGWTPAQWLGLGYVVVGPEAFRVDQHETIGARLRALAKAGAFVAPPELVEVVGEARAAAVLRAAGFVAVEGRWVLGRRR